jgi:hypothetical protein
MEPLLVVLWRYTYVLGMEAFTAQTLSNLSREGNGTRTFTVAGEIRGGGNAMPNLFVEAFDSDFGSADDYLGNAFTDSGGKFKIEFDQKSFKGSIDSIFQQNSSDGPYNFLERRPDVYLVVYDEYRAIHKTEVRSEAHDTEFFDIVISDDRPFEDPYANAMQRMIASFGSIGETIDAAQVDPQRTTTQLLRTLSSWLHYSDPNITMIYGYPGPQVIRHPKQVPGHSHVVVWRKTGEAQKKTGGKG